MAIVGEELAGDPMSDLRWVRRSLRKLQRALAKTGEVLSHVTIGRILLAHDIRPKGCVKHLTPTNHPDRDTQFLYLTEQRRRFEHAALPVVSVDTKKKELIGPFHRPGKTWIKRPHETYSHDFPTQAIAKIVPYGVFDIRQNVGHLYVGQSNDTPDFAVNAVATWWRTDGRRRYPRALELLILADGGGSNGYRARRWKWGLQVQLADAFGLAVTVCHYPPGASKWNPIEHRLFSAISETWRGMPLISIDLLLHTVRATTTLTGLKVNATLVENTFPGKLKVSAQDWKSMLIQFHVTCPKWNYTISPRPKKRKLFLYSPYLNNALVDCLQKHRVANDLADSAYGRVLSIGPEAPPNWVIASIRRTGELWLTVIDLITHAPVPDTWKSDPELSAAYQDTLENTMAPFKTRLLNDAKGCLQKATAYKIENDDVRWCREIVRTVRAKP